MRLRSIFDSIEFIENNLDSPIQVRDAASMAAYSEYHYSRVFKALVGDSPKNYVRLRRLTKAATDLVRTSKPILSIALDYQYESQEAFTRAFQSLFLETPASFRKRGEINHIRFKRAFDEELLQHYTEKMSMEPTIKHRAAAQYVGTLNYYDLDNLDVLQLWSAFKPYRDSIPNRVGNHVFGLYRGFEQRDSGFHYSYSCCAEVSNLNSIPDGMTGWTLEEHSYAVFEHRVGLRALGDTLRYIWGSWLPKSKYEYSATIDFEVYTNKFNHQQPDKNAIQIWIPVHPK